MTIGFPFHSVAKQIATFLICLPCAVSAQTTVSVGGHVVNVSGKPIPNAKITASGKETAPAISDSSGVYIISLSIPPGQPVHFHVEQASYSPLDSTLSVAPPLPTDFTLRTNKIVSAKTALIALHGGLNAVDIPYRVLDCKQPPCPGPYQSFPVGVRTKIDTNGEVDAIDFVSQDSQGNANGSVFGTISLQDISRLTDEQKVMIVVYEESVRSDYAAWASLSSQLQSTALSSTDKAVIATRLVAAGKDMCGNFSNMLDILQDVNLQVWDHYWGIKSVCERFRLSHIVDSAQGGKGDK